MPPSERRFQKRVEHFTCEHCGREVEGTGFTNHCPACLWAKHVDVNPGDRASRCGGLMQPVAVEQKRGRYVLLHRCMRCGLERRNRVADVDDFERVLDVARSRQG